MTEKVVNLESQDLVALWMKGRDKWNQWILENPESKVIFSKVPFSSSPAQFSGFHFPAGGAQFIDCKFLNGSDFSNTKFLGDIKFYNTIFTGDSNFSNAHFSQKLEFENIEFRGTVIFSNAQFGSHCSFIKSQFHGGASFRKANFKGEALFPFAHFYKSIDFYEANFDQNSNFTNVQFDGDAKFYQSQFKRELDMNSSQFKEIAIFHGAQFHGKAIFSNIYFASTANFEVSHFYTNAIFNDTSFKGVAKFPLVKFDDKADFRGSLFQQHADFSHLFAEDTTLFSFRGSTFDKSLDFSGNFRKCIPDLTQTKTNHHISLSGLNINFSPPPSPKKPPKGRWYLGKYFPTEEANFLEQAHLDSCQMITDSYRRLKELAENNRAHGKTLLFNAGEMRALRHQRSKGAAILDWFFDFISNYGQSISRPLLGLVLLFLSMSAVFFFNGDQLSPHTSPSTQSETVNSSPRLISATYLSAYQTLPFLPIGRLERKGLIQELYKDQRPKWFGLAVIIQSILSFILLFLTGLGLRNRFRI